MKITKERLEELGFVLDGFIHELDCVRVLPSSFKDPTVSEVYVCNGRCGDLGYDRLVRGVHTEEDLMTLVRLVNGEPKPKCEGFHLVWDMKKALNAGMIQHHHGWVKQQGIRIVQETSTDDQGERIHLLVDAIPIPLPTFIAHSTLPYPLEG